MNLNDLERKFDIIECVGVLHHTDNPMVGWQILAGLLKPGGLMKIGLYSELSRQHIVKVREEIEFLGVGTSEADIREFRQSLAESDDKNHQLLTKSNDFFSLSMLRDLIFHVQEHRFTLPQIRNCLSVLGLEFCGFEKSALIEKFRLTNIGTGDLYDLDKWHAYEEANPNTFLGMYQFWCQKIG